MQGNIMSNSTLLDTSPSVPDTNIDIHEDAPQHKPERTLRDQRDFIMHMTGTKTYWPAILLASALIAVSIVLLISIAL